MSRNIIQGIAFLLALTLPLEPGAQAYSLESGIKSSPAVSPWMNAEALAASDLTAHRSFFQLPPLWQTFCRKLLWGAGFLGTAASAMTFGPNSVTIEQGEGAGAIHKALQTAYQQADPQSLAHHSLLSQPLYSDHTVVRLLNTLHAGQGLQQKTYSLEGLHLPQTVQDALTGAHFNALGQHTNTWPADLPLLSPHPYNPIVQIAPHATSWLTVLHAGEWALGIVLLVAVVYMLWSYRSLFFALGRAVSRLGRYLFTIPDGKNPMLFAFKRVLIFFAPLSVPWIATQVFHHLHLVEIQWSVFAPSPMEWMKGALLTLSLTAAGISITAFRARRKRWLNWIKEEKIIYLASSFVLTYFSALFFRQDDHYLLAGLFGGWLAAIGLISLLQKLDASPKRNHDLPSVLRDASTKTMKDRWLQESRALREATDLLWEDPSMVDRMLELWEIVDKRLNNIPVPEGKAPFAADEMLRWYGLSDTLHAVKNQRLLSNLAPKGLPMTIENGVHSNGHGSPMHANGFSHPTRVAA